MSANDKIQCLICSKNVAKRAYIVQCNECSGWVHTKCAKVSSALYLLIKECRSQCAHSLISMNIKCSNCKLKPETKTSSVNVEDDSDCPSSQELTLPAVDESFDITCIPATALSASTPNDVSLSEDVPNVGAVSPQSLPSIQTNASMKNESKSYAAAVTGARLAPYTSASSAAPERLPSGTERKAPEFLKSTPRGVNGGYSWPKNSISRERSIIILKAPESTKPLPEDRIRDDKQLLTKCISMMFEESEGGVRVLCAFRLGKRKEDFVTNPRPLKVILESEMECRRILGRTYRLKGQSIYIVRDLSPNDRAKLKEAVCELRKRKELGETNLKIVDFQVVSIPMRTRWKPVFIVPSKDHR